MTGLTALVAASVTPSAIAADSVSISRDWRFTKGDPAGLTTDLRYDVRPPIADTGDGKLADTPADAAVKVDGGGAQLLKPWILPSANPFIKDAAKHHVRPAGNPGGDVPYVQGDFDDSAWTHVDLPHDWAIAGPFIKDGPYGGMGRLPSWGIGWYRKTLDIPTRDKGKSIFLDVEGAMSYATVWLNGQLVGGWPYGYNSFRLDLTPYAVPGGKNQLAIRLDNPAASARWYPGGGLYRDISLTTANKVHVGQWGGTVRTPQVAKDRATIDLSLTIDNDDEKAAQVEVATALYALDANGKRAGRPVASIARQSASIAPGAKVVLNGSTILNNPRLWGPPPTQQPNRYVALSTVTQGGKTIDTYETRFGVRDIQFDPDKGVIVNGEHIPLRGVNNHHDLGAIGAAFNRRAAQRQLEILRDMGTNAVRMSHNPPAPELLELTDQMGFLVMDEIFDSWEKKKTPHDFHLIFPDWHEADLRSMLRRDRNHPSIIMWSVGNEVGEQYDGEAGAKIGRELVAIAHEEDPTRLATGAMNFAKADMLLPTTVDAISLNYQGAGIRGIIGQYPAFRAKFPDKVILSTESASALSSRGEYMFPVAGAISGPVRPWSGGNPDTHQVSAYELHAADFGSSPDRVWAADDQNPYVAGEFVWTGFDYLGEPTPYYTSRSSYSGIVDLAGFPKDRFWLYQARWRPDLQFAHILPHWTWPDRVGQITPVHVFSSADEAELFVNGKSQGKIKKRDYEYRFRWDYVVYAPGEVKVVTWKTGKPWATQTIRTVGEAAKMSLTADRSAIASDGRDLSFVTLEVLDKDGQIVPAAKQNISFTIEGPGQIVATDNGDPTDLTAFPSHSRAAFNGLALAIVKADRPGRIILRAHAAGLGETQVEIGAKR
ncbi:glycoside hydrolase family 2 protein [Sphingobium sp. AR-3-1]|uniref:Glycoside hydrolase family 2 protein n=1 Tax=Sphingobium psychrophilum TaxID=2728834 RepID=A0A7X9ZQY4_9SPHN|nr:beta-galactosidase GalB [Sphingobium psychrophilum]NML09428.1 glycoside hydrolase family 2 protein [Sphingobium psychrophilum]